MPEETKPRGGYKKFLHITCGICQKMEEHEFSSEIATTERLSNENWRVSEHFGWVHQSCLPRAPKQIKFT